MQGSSRSRYSEPYLRRTYGLANSWAPLVSACVRTHDTLSESWMREIRTSGSMSGEWKRAWWAPRAPATERPATRKASPTPPRHSSTLLSQLRRSVNQVRPEPCAPKGSPRNRTWRMSSRPRGLDAGWLAFDEKVEAPRSRDTLRSAQIPNRRPLPASRPRHHPSLRRLRAATVPLDLL